MDSPVQCGSCRTPSIRIVSFWLLVSVALGTPLTAQLTVTSTQPTARSLGAPLIGPITVQFDRAVDPLTVQAPGAFWAFGRWSGVVSGSFTFTNGGATVSLVPDQPLSAGESVTVYLSNDLRAVDGNHLRTEGYSFQFWAGSSATDLELVEVDRFSTRTSPGVTSRAYGGFATDLDDDGYPDITIVNEDTNDLRTFLNVGDGSGLFEPFLEPPAGTGSVPSPSEPSDFDGDGFADVAVANTTGSSVSILLGNGDGTFAPQQLVPLPASPRGIAVLDADGDGDVDVAATSAAASGLGLMLNDGNGVFSAPIDIGAGGGGAPGAWALASADMNEDGILDLVVASQSSGTGWIYTGNGDGTFTQVSDRSFSGNPWMIVLGDVNGDGHEDVSVAGSSSNHGSILLGNGDGTLGGPTIYSTDPFPLATDLGDLDGDGDLDWITASFSGDWRLFTNDGAGTFTFDRDFAAPRAASCSLMVDMDNDGDLDVALIDELADEIIILHANGNEIFTDGFESGTTLSWSSQVP